MGPNLAAQAIADSIPASNLSFIDAEHAFSQGEMKDTHVRRLLATAKQLDTLVVGYRMKVSLSLHTSLGLPPVRNLHFAWHDYEVSTFPAGPVPPSIFNVASLMNLVSPESDFEYALFHLPTGGLTGLRSLIVDMPCQPSYSSTYLDLPSSVDPEAAGMAIAHMLELTTHLRVLSVACVVKSFPVSSICGNKALRSLCLQDIGIFKT